MDIRIAIPTKHQALRIIILSFVLIVAGAIALALTGLLIPLSWIGKGIALVGLVGGGVAAVLLYSVWGKTSLLADANVWLVALLAGFGSGVVQALVCGMTSMLTRLSFLERLLTTCTLSHRRAATYGGALAVTIVTFGVWIAVRYMTWQASRQQ